MYQFLIIAYLFTLVRKSGNDELSEVTSTNKSRVLELSLNMEIQNACSLTHTCTTTAIPTTTFNNNNDNNTLKKLNDKKKQKMKMKNN